MARRNISDEELMEAFYDIDVNGDGRISSSELRRYLRRYELDDRLIDSELENLEVDEHGNIYRENWEHRFKNVTISIEYTSSNDNSDVKVIASDMKPGMQNAVIRCVKNRNEIANSNKDLAKAIKSRLDIRLDRLWHVVIVKGQYWAYYSHEPEASVVFSYRGHIYVIWKTPGY